MEHPQPDVAHACAPEPGSPAAGRSCPLHYRYAPSVFARAAEHRCDVLYVVGGLYGNEAALDAVCALFEREAPSKRLFFNGDFNWFDTDPDTFERLNRRVLAFDALRGNVETELVSATGDDSQAGCGCAYPAWVGDAVVERSNRIMQRLQATARRFPVLTQRLAALPMHARIDIASLRVAVLHGDAQSLSGWGFAQEHLRHAEHRAGVRRWFDTAQVDAFACSHTCLPVFCSLPANGRSLAPMVLNNGSAGMPNFRGRCEGLLTRIAVRPFEGHERCYGVVRNGIHIDAIAVPFNAKRWTQRFLSDWPEGSDAHASYWPRIRHGPAYETADAVIDMLE
jgi:hypothetical protein